MRVAPPKESVLLAIADAFFELLAILVAFVVRFRLGVGGETLYKPSPTSYIAPWLVLAVFWFVIFYAHNLYVKTRFTTVLTDISSLFKAVFVGILILAAVTADPEQPFRIPRLIIFTYWGALFVLLAVERIIFRRTVRSLWRRGIDKSRVLVVGEPGYMKLVTGYINSHPELGATVVTSGQQTDFDEVVIVLENPKDSEIIEILAGIPQKGKLFRVMSGITDVLKGKRVSNLYGVPTVIVKFGILSEWGKIGKSMFEITFVSLLLAAFSPLFLLWGLLLHAKGERFERRVVVSVSSERFCFPVLKDHFFPFFELFLLLPEVLKGRITLVGPLLFSPEAYERLSGEPAMSFFAKQNVRSGLVSLSRFYLLSHPQDIKTAIEYDIFYIEGWRIFLDLEIVIKAIFTPQIWRLYRYEDGR
ncbi:sugar transferase [bacterium]|nr:sugar transferase [bacterium]